MKYASSILEVYFKYTLGACFQYIWSVLKVHLILVRETSGERNRIRKHEYWNAENNKGNWKTETKSG